MIKVANNIQRMLEEQMSNKPMAYGVGGALAGAGLGAGGGALYELLKGKKDKNYLKAMLMGAGVGGLGGGLLGTGAGMYSKKQDKDRDEAASQLQGIRELESREKDVKTEEEPAPGAIMHNPPDALQQLLKLMNVKP